MTKSLTVESEIHFEKRRAGQRVMETGPATERPNGRLPRITRLMALAIRCERLIREGEITDYAELARLGHVTRARVTQIMNLCCWHQISRRRFCICREWRVAMIRSCCEICRGLRWKRTGESSDKPGQTSRPERSSLPSSAENRLLLPSRCTSRMRSDIRPVFLRIAFHIDGSTASATT